MSLVDTVTVGNAAHEDIVPGIADVLKSTSLIGDFTFPPKTVDENIHYSLSRSIDHRYEGVYVATYNDANLEGRSNEVFGFAWFMNHPPNNGTAILEMFAVREDVQGHGIGTKLIREASDVFVEDQRQKGIILRTLHLTTNFDNESAQTIYQRAGYTIAGKVEGFVGEGNVEYVMVKKLASGRAPERYQTRF